MYSPERLRRLMETQGRKHDWLADQTDYARETVSRFMTGEYPISDKFALRAAKALQVPVEWLCDPEPAAVA
jgi:plasmid maintenance system antidote protein VapI